MRFYYFFYDRNFGGFSVDFFFDTFGLIHQARKLLAWYVPHCNTKSQFPIFWIFLISFLKILFFGATFHHIFVMHFFVRNGLKRHAVRGLKSRSCRLLYKHGPDDDFFSTFFCNWLKNKYFWREIVKKFNYRIIRLKHERGEN